MLETVGVRPGSVWMTNEEAHEFRRELAVLRIADALREALADMRPDVRVKDYVTCYPNEAPQDLREIAKRTIDLVTYNV